MTDEASRTHAETRFADAAPAPTASGHRSESLPPPRTRVARGLAFLHLVSSWALDMRHVPGTRGWQEAAWLDTWLWWAQVARGIRVRSAHQQPPRRLALSPLRAGAGAKPAWVAARPSHQALLSALLPPTQVQQSPSPSEVAPTTLWLPRGPVMAASPTRLREALLKAAGFPASAAFRGPDSPGLPLMGAEAAHQLSELPLGAQGPGR